MHWKGKVRLMCGVLILTMLPLYPTLGNGQGGNQQMLPCNVHKGSCTGYLVGYRVSLDIHPKPVKAMKDLVFTLSLEGKKPVNHPYIDLGMPGMNMGRNRVRLKPIDESVFQGAGTIVR